MLGWKSLTSEEGQKLMMEHAKQTVYQNNVEQEEKLNGMMQCSAYSCSFDDQSLTYEFPITEWMENRVGQLHGGIICTAFDVTIAALSRFFAGENFAPTVNLDVNYVRPAYSGDTLVVTATAVAVGKRLTHVTAEAFSKKTGKLVASATSINMNIDTDKEHK